VAIFGTQLLGLYLTVQFPNAAQAILSAVERYRSLGYRETQQGVRLFGPVPHVARQAWCHAIPRGLTDQEIFELSSTLSTTIPIEYATFLHTMNGAHLFAGALALYGMRPAAAGRNVDSAFLPFDIVDANSQEKPRRLRPALFIIGGYRFDGSLVAIDASNGHVVRIERDSGTTLNCWPSLGDFLTSETRRLDGLHDATGRLITTRGSLVPQVNQ